MLSNFATFQGAMPDRPSPPLPRANYAEVISTITRTTASVKSMTRTVGDNGTWRRRLGLRRVIQAGPSYITRFESRRSGDSARSQVRSSRHC
jgi:hypothetical protein